MEAAEAELVIDARGLSRRFDSTVALDGLTLQVRRGEVFGILGHNGAGKTTFLRLVNGLLRPSAGSIHTFGLPSYARGATIRSRSGVVTESTALDDFLSVRENLTAYGTMSGMGRDRIDGRVEELLVRFDLATVAEKQVRQLSAGMRQRAAFARGLVHEPDLLLLDEPTANMDPVAARHIRRLVTGLARQSGATIVLSTHNLAEAQDVCDRIAVLRQGRLQAIGTMTELARLTGDGVRTVDITTHEEQITAALEVASRFGIAVVDGRPDVVSIQRADDTDTSHLVAALVAAGIAVRGVVEAQPTLEDVYMALHATGTSP